MSSRGGRSSALDRAQALLSARRNRGGDADSAERHSVKTPINTGPVREAVKTRSVPPQTHNLPSDLSDLSSVSSAADHGGGILDSPAKKIQGNGGGSVKDPKTQSSIGGGSRFLKKNTPPSATNSTQSPTFSKSQMPEPRHVPSSKLASARGLTLTESSSHKDSLKKVQERRPDVGIIPQPSASQSLKALFSSDPSLKRFIKTKAAAPVDSSHASSLKINEEKMVNLLLGDSGSTKSSLLPQERPSTMRSAEKMLSKKSPKVSSTPCSAAVRPSSSCSSLRGSPFKALLSPSVLSPSPSPPCVSSAPSLGSPSRAESPHSSLSSLLGHNEALSLDELFVAGPGSEDTHSEMSLSTSEDFKINIVTLDDLGPVTAGFTEETTQNEGESNNSKHKAVVPTSLNGHQQLSGLKEGEREEEEQQEEEVLDYQSDFESESRTEADYSASQVLECLVGDTEEEKDVSEISEEAQESHGRSKNDHSSRFSDRRCSSATRTSSRSPTSISRSRGSRASASHASRSSSRQLRRRSLPSRVLKEAAVQTQPDPLAYARSAGIATLAPEVHATYMDPTPVASYAVNAETVEALSTYNPAMFALNEMLRQQLTMTRQFIERSRYLHSCLVQSLGPPNYKYTTLEETMEYIEKHRAPKLTMEKALEEVLQEMRDYHYI